MKAIISAILCAAIGVAQPDGTKWMELNSAGIRMIQQGDFASAETKFRAALLEAEKFGENDYRLTANLSNIAFALQNQDDLAGAEKLYRHVLELRQKYMKPDAVEIASTLNNLATVLHSQGHEAESDELARRALLISENAHDEKQSASILNTLALALMGEGEEARAEPLLRRAMAMFEHAAGPDSFDLGKSANNLAAVYSREGEIAKAEEMERIAIPLYQKNLPAGHPLMAVVQSNMFTYLAGQKRFEEGEPYLMRALAIAEGRDPRSLQTQLIRTNLAWLQAARGLWKETAATLEQVIGEEERLLGANDPRLAASLSSYSEALRHLNHKAEAKNAERRANEIIKSFSARGQGKPDFE